MLRYENLKNWASAHKDVLIAAACFVLIFFVGFGTGSYVKKQRKLNSSQVNYTTKQTQKPAPVAVKKPVAAVAGDSTTTQATACVIKGNISSGGKKIFHVQGGAFYARVKPEQCFSTEQEALAAGFVKSSR